MSYPKDLLDSINSHEGAKATAKLYYDRVKVLEKSLKSVQDELETWKTKFHAADKDKGVLTAKLETNVSAEIIKFIVSGGLMGWGVNLFSSNNFLGGGAAIVAAVGAYTLIVVFSKKQ